MRVATNENVIQASSPSGLWLRNFLGRKFPFTRSGSRLAFLLLHGELLKKQGDYAAPQWFRSRTTLLAAKRFHGIHSRRSVGWNKAGQHRDRKQKNGKNDKDRNVD